MNLIIAGSRSITDYAFAKAHLDRLTKNLDKPKLVIFSGHAKGADRLGERWAFENRVTMKLFHPDWSKGKQAGLLRNVEMVDEADALIALWDGKSSGTKHVIETAKRKNLKVRVIEFNETGKEESK